jgi:hypothetical protein
MKQQARYNNRVGLYPTNRIEQYKMPWSSSWGPTPTHWYSAEDQDFPIDYGSIKKDFVSYIAPGSYTYSTTKNGLPVVTAVAPYVSFVTTFTPDSIGYNTTIFTVVKPSSYDSNERNILVQASYQPVATPLITGSTNLLIYQTGYIAGVSGYTTDNGITQTNTIVTGTYSTNEWSVVVHKGKSSLAQTSSGTINGRTMGATTSSTGFSYAGANGVTTETWYGGSVAEVIIYTSILSGANTTLVEDYLKTKWGISY